jgi:hypothetical protein
MQRCARCVSPPTANVMREGHANIARHVIDAYFRPLFLE